MVKGSSVQVLSAWPSPFAARALIAVELKGIEYELLEQDLCNKSQLLLDSNPIYKKVPVLIHNGKAVAESAIIVEYVDEAWPDKAPFFPKDPYGRAQERFWGDFFDKKVNDSMLKVIKANSDEALAAANEEFIDNCKIFEDELSKHSSGPFFGGESMSYVDILLAPFALWSSVFVAEAGLKIPSKEECPKLHQLFAAVLESPVGKAVFPDVGKLTKVIAPTLTGLRNTGKISYRSL